MSADITTIMAQLKAPYDPIKSVEGMFNGTLTRLGYFFKDPDNYGASTKVVLSETAKRYQDALDDCEIQILEAKWYLEHQLQLHRRRREAQAQKEDVTAAKRKLDEMKDAGTMNGADDNANEKPAKRLRIEENKPEDRMDVKIDQAMPESEAAATAGKVTQEVVAEAVKPPIAPPTSKPMQPIPAKPSIDIPRAPPDPPPIESRPSTSAGPQRSEQVTPATANEDFNFESMFGEPSNDLNDGNLNFDLDLNGDGNLDDSSNLNFQDPSSLNSLLPGLESYANQSNDNGMSFTTNAGKNGDHTVANNFDLPEIGDSTFDDLLNDNNLGGDFGGTGGDDFLDGGSLMNLEDLDTSFLDG